MIFHFVKPAAVQNWIQVNSPANQDVTPMQAWKKFLLAGGGTGNSLAEMETNWLKAVPQSATGGSLFDLWQNYLSSVAGGSQVGDARTKFQNRYR